VQLPNTRRSKNPLIWNPKISQAGSSSGTPPGSPFNIRSIVSPDRSLFRSLNLGSSTPGGLNPNPPINPGIPASSSQAQTPAMAYFDVNSPILFNDYHEMPKNPEKICPKYQLHQDPEDHIRIFKEACFRAMLEHEDVVCRLFPYTFNEQASSWYVNLPNGYISSWALMEEAFLSRFRGPIDPCALYHKLAAIKRGEGELIDNFNDRFQKAYSRLVPPYTIDDAPLLAMY